MPTGCAIDISYLDARVEAGGTVPPCELASLRPDLVDVLKTLTQMPFTLSEEPRGRGWLRAREAHPFSVTRTAACEGVQAGLG